jgi:hypothetical protein
MSSKSSQIIFATFFIANNLGSRLRAGVVFSLRFVLLLLCPSPRTCPLLTEGPPSQLATVFLLDESVSRAATPLGEP